MIIHLSDLHIGLSEEEAANVKRIFNWIRINHPGAVVLITGDITDSAELDELQEAATLIGQLWETNRVLIVPGNHDYAWKGNVCREDGWEHWKKYLGDRYGGDSEYIDGLKITIIGDCSYFSVDSGDPNDKEISARGYVSEALAAMLKDQLRLREGLTRVVFLHHHPFTDGFFTRLHGSEILMDAIIENCELLLFGHEHHFGTWATQKNGPLIVASHKSTDEFGECLLVGFVDEQGCELRPVPIVA